MPQVMFEDLGLKYIGPVNGHDIAQSRQLCAAADPSTSRSSFT